MPISAEKMKLYPGGSIKSPEWQAIRERIRIRASNCCEKCGVESHVLGGRPPSEKFIVLPQQPTLFAKMLAIFARRVTKKRRSALRRRIHHLGGVGHVTARTKRAAKAAFFNG